jgi:hypothetical protein
VSNGDIVVFRNPRPDSGAGIEHLVKRVWAVSGEPVPWSQEAVPADHVAVGGDGGRSASSEELGFIRVSEIVGVARRPRPTDQPHHPRGTSTP